MTADEIKAFTPTAFCYDLTYAVPTLDWILKEFFPAWKAERIAKGIWQYTRENDCDNYGRSFASCAQDAWAQSHSNDDEAVAIGEFCYVRDDGKGGHAIVEAFCELGRVFIEPQLGEVLTLSEKEIKSCMLCAF